MKKPLTAYLFFLALPFFLPAQQAFDSLGLKLPKHYFQTLINIDSYHRGETTLTDTTHRIGKRLKTFAVRQAFVNFYAPVSTRTWTGPDSAVKNTHVLLTGNYLRLRPQFGGLEQHDLVKFGLGVRFIFNSGKKGVWFADVSPFVTVDASHNSQPYYRMANTFVYSHNSSYRFNWRVGITKSFLWGNRLYLPYVGFRMGAVDKAHLSIQFPRAISFVVPMGSKVIFSVYSRAQGGMFNFSNADTLYNSDPTLTFHFALREVLYGGRFDFKLGSHFHFYLATGFSTRNNLSFYSEAANQNRKVQTYDTYFYTRDVAPSLYLNFGLTFRFGKARSSYKNKNILDAIDMNNGVQDISPSPQIQLTPRKNSRLNLESVQDLVDYNEI